MQGKVSMVVPCYNKGEYIDDMLRSVYRQRWDRIELILVNDGSTDNTRDVISLWESKFIERGYEVIIIDQENAGCCAAVYNGMQCMSGDYFCLVDCDDEIYPEYVSRMAGWLDNHKDYDLAACNCIMYKGTKEDQIHHPHNPLDCKHDAPNLLENFLLCKIYTAAWMYMARSERAMRIIDSFCIERRKTYEPCIVIPLALNVGKVKFFEEPLYKFNLYANGFVGFKSFKDASAYYDDYAHLHKWVIERQNISEVEKNRLIALGKFGCLKKKLTYSLGWLYENGKNTPIVLQELFGFLNEISGSKLSFPADDLLKKKECLFPAVEYALLSEPKTSKSINFSRVIGYGALGASAKNKLELLKNTRFYPNILWDIAANEYSSIRESPVSLPNLDSVSQSDLIIVLPGALDVCEDIKKSFIEKNIRNFLFFKDMKPIDFFEGFGNISFESGCPT